MALKHRLIHGFFRAVLLDCTKFHHPYSEDDEYLNTDSNDERILFYFIFEFINVIG